MKLEKYKVMTQGSPLFVTTNCLKDAEKMAKEHKKNNPDKTIIIKELHGSRYYQIMEY